MGVLKRKKSINYRLVAIILIVIMTFVSLPYSAFASETNAISVGDEERPIIKTSDSGLIDYTDYIAQFDKVEYATENIVVNGAEATFTGDAQVKDEYEGMKNVLFWESGKGSITWSFEVNESGLYNFAFTYLPLKSGVNVQYELLIDGAIPFNGMDTLEFTRDWINTTEEPRTDARGNEIAQEQIETGKYVRRLATDKTGIALEPYCFALTAGTHTVTLVGKGFSVAIAEIGFTAPEVAKHYEEISKDYNITTDKTVAPIVIHAENAVCKNDNSLIPKSIGGSAGTYPSDPYLTKVNAIGGTNWQNAGQSISWNFKVETAGYYQFGARYKQSDVINGESWRWLKIDDVTPFTEAKQMRFGYDTGWQYFEMGEGENPYYIWLDEGEHILSMEVTLGELAEFYDRLNKVVSTIGDMYLKIVMVTGETVDVNRDYELFKQIPDFTDILTATSEELSSIVFDLQNLTGKRGSQYIAAMNNMNRVIKQMLGAPYIAHIYLKDYYSNYTTLSSWLSEMKKMPVVLDEMQFIYAGQDFDWKQPNVFEKAWFGIERLLSSFVNDYNLYDEGEEDDVTLKLWINWGRDQTAALNSLIQDSFTAKTGINVDLQIVSASLINGLLSGNFPDIQLHLPRTDPVNYGMRGALLDLTEFEDYKEVLTRFQKGADIPYWYNDALYAIPDTQNFFCMFYRTDVFEQLGLTVPTTWDEFLYCATIIQRYNMDVYVPYTQITTTTTVNSGIGSLNLYPTLMMQSGLELYNDERNATAIDSVRGIQVFEEWTDIYTDYGYLKEADFYNRFRNGSMPLGVASYTNYLTIYSAAPEIEGRWTIANVPGTKGGSNVVSGGGTGAGIVARTAHPEEAWEFLKWWTSAEIQTRYSNNVESLVGMLGRIPTANVEAFTNLSWVPGDLEKLLQQWNKVKEVPEVPGGYYLTRAVDQAFWSVINDGINPKDAVTQWSIIANNEIKQKIEEYS